MTGEVHCYMHASIKYRELYEESYARLSVYKVFRRNTISVAEVQACQNNLYFIHKVLYEESVCMPEARRRSDPSKKISSLCSLSCAYPLLLNKQSSYISCL